MCSSFQCPHYCGIDLTTASFRAPFILNERQTKHFLIRNFMKQILKTLSKSAIINDLIKNYEQNNAENRFLPCIKSNSTKR